MPAKPNLLSRRERAKADKRSRILKASRTLFSKQGFERTTVQEIADSADIAVGTLFLYVRDKHELLLMLFTDGLKEAASQSQRQLQGRKSLRPAILAFFQPLLALYEEDVELSRLFWREFLLGKGANRAEIDAISTTILASLRERLLTAIKQKEVSSRIEPGVAALHLYAIFQATLSFHLVDCGPTASSVETLSLLLESFWTGLKPDKKTTPHS